MTTICINSEMMGQLADAFDASEFSEAIEKAGGKLVDLEAFLHDDTRTETYEVPEALMPMIRLMNWHDGKERERESVRQGFWQH